MKYRSNRFAKSLFAAVVLIFCSAFFLTIQAQGQTIEETEVPVLKEIHTQNFECEQTENAVISKEAFGKILAAKDCSYLTKTLKVDFDKQTLLNYRVRGDCFVHATAKIFRSDKEKKYTVRIKKFSGGCRAAGTFQSWLVIKKIPNDYKVEFSGTIAEYKEWNEKDVTRFINSYEPLETKSINLKNCIQTIFNTQFVIKDKETYLKTIRGDASRDYCLKNLQEIDFGKHTLLGISINSGYCGTPLGLEYQVVKDTEKKQYHLNVSYDPQGAICRALSQYDLWLLVPKLPDDYEVKFDVKARQKVDN